MCARKSANKKVSNIYLVVGIYQANFNHHKRSQMSARRCNGPTKKNTRQATGWNVIWDQASYSLSAYRLSMLPHPFSSEIVARFFCFVRDSFQFFGEKLIFFHSFRGRVCVFFFRSAWLAELVFGFLFFIFCFATLPDELGRRQISLVKIYRNSTSYFMYYVYKA